MEVIGTFSRLYPVRRGMPSFPLPTGLRADVVALTHLGPGGYTLCIIDE